MVTRKGLPPPCPPIVRQMLALNEYQRSHTQHFCSPPREAPCSPLLR